jgi:hypothetical protein
MDVTACAVAALEKMDRRKYPNRSNAEPSKGKRKPRELGIQCNADSCGTDKHRSQREVPICFRKKHNGPAALSV